MGLSVRLRTAEVHPLPTPPQRIGGLVWVHKTPAIGNQADYPWTDWHSYMACLPQHALAVRESAEHQLSELWRKGHHGLRALEFVLPIYCRYGTAPRFGLQPGPYR